MLDALTLLAVVLVVSGLMGYTIGYSRGTADATSDCRKSGFPNGCPMNATKELANKPIPAN